jgi:hypothetical protein
VAESLVAQAYRFQSWDSKILINFHHLHILKSFVVSQVSLDQDLRSCQEFIPLLLDYDPLSTRIRIRLSPARHRPPIHLVKMSQVTISAGTGQKLTHATIIVAGVAALVASLLSIVYGP